MAELADIERALRAADAAGNTEDARRLAEAYQAARGQQTQAATQQAQPQAQKPNALVDSIRSLPGGLAKGIAGTLGMVGDLKAMTDSGVDWAVEALGASPERMDLIRQNRAALADSPAALPTTERFNQVFSAPEGGYYEPQTTAGEYAQTIASFAPNAAFPGSAAARMARVLVPAIGSETGGQLTKGKPYEGLARAGGALAGGIGEGFAEAAIAARNVPKGARFVADTMRKGGIDRDQVLSEIRNDPGGNLSLMDTGGTNSPQQRMARGLVTMNTPQSKPITTFLNERGAGQYDRVAKNVRNDLFRNSDTYGTFEGLSKARSTAATPLYEEAFRGGSMAPLEEQFRRELQNATGSKGAIAKQIAKIERESSGALAARGVAGAQTRQAYMELRSKLDEAEQGRQSVLSLFQRAQADKTANAPGAVWNPRVQQFLDDPIIQQGVQKGLEVQRLEALAEGRAFNPTEYAIVGKAEDGKAIVGSVPNMRLLDAAKRGLDEILEGYRDGTTRKLNLDQRGRAIDNVRKALVSELDSINPNYKPARDAWAGPSQSMNAVSMGEDFLQRDAEEISRAMASMSSADRDFYKLGAARTLQDKAASAADNADLTKRLFGNPAVRKKISEVFGSGAADSFAKSMAAERQMFDTQQFVLGGSQSANKFGDLMPPTTLQNMAADAVQGGVAGMMGGGPKGAAIGAIALPVVNMGRKLAGSISGRNVMSKPDNAQMIAELLMARGPQGAQMLQNTLPNSSASSLSPKLIADLLLSQQGAR